jgi:hypothetical protein
VKHVSEVVHELRREQVKTDRERANECESDSENGLECHGKASVSIGG